MTVPHSYTNDNQERVRWRMYHPETDREWTTFHKYSREEIEYMGLSSEILGPEEKDSR